MGIAMDMQIELAVQAVIGRRNVITESVGVKAESVKSDSKFNPGRRISALGSTSFRADTLLS